MEDLVLANARSARQLLGVPTLATPTADTDTALSFRSRVLLRALYPSAAPPPAHGISDASRGADNGTGPASASKALAIVAPTTASSSSTAPAPPSLGALTTTATARQAPASTAASDSLLSGTKRGRGALGGDDGGDGDGILSVNPEELKKQHALLVAASAHDATKASANSGTYKPPPTWKMSKVLVGHQGWVWAAAVDPTNSWFATGGFDAVIKVWDLSTGALKMNLTGHKETVRGLALSPNSPYMFSASDDHSVKCWDLERNEVVREFFGHRSAVHCVAVHPSLDVVFSGGRDKTVRVWDVRTRACVHTMEGHTDSVMSIVSQPSEPQLLSGGSDGMIYLWDVASGRSITRLTRHTKPVRGLAITPSGEELVSCGADEIRFWKMPSGDFECNASTIVDHPSKNKKKMTGQPGGADADEEELAYRWSCCAVSPRGVLCVGSQDGHLGIYDTKRPQSHLTSARFYCPYQLTKTKSIPGTLTGEGGVNCVVYDASGTRMITAESDKSVKIWKLREE